MRSSQSATCSPRAFRERCGRAPPARARGGAGRPGSQRPSRSGLPSASMMSSRSFRPESAVSVLRRAPHQGARSTASHAARSARSQSARVSCTRSRTTMRSRSGTRSTASTGRRWAASAAIDSAPRARARRPAPPPARRDRACRSCAMRAAIACASARRVRAGRACSEMRGEAAGAAGGAAGAARRSRGSSPRPCAARRAAGKTRANTALANSTSAGNGAEVARQAQRREPHPPDAGASRAFR